MSVTDTDTTQIAEHARRFLEGILERMDFDADVEISEQDDRIILDIDCDNVERVIGRRGQVIDALQHLVGKVSFRDRAAGTRGKPIVVDADGYRIKLIERLESLAEKMANKALDTGETVSLNPMSAHDRRIVHMALADFDGVSTRSEGEGDDRHVLVVPD
jgi:spoIIIJ-associated protein